MGDVRDLGWKRRAKELPWIVCPPPCDSPKWFVMMDPACDTHLPGIVVAIRCATCGNQIELVEHGVLKNPIEVLT